METREQRIRRKFRRVVNTAPEFMNSNKKKGLDLLCSWFEKNHREITRKELDEIIKQSK